MLGERCALHALLATLAGILDPHVAQHLHFGRHIVELFADIGTDLGEHTAAAALSIGEREFMADLDPLQVRGQLRATGLPPAGSRPAAGWL